MHACRSGIDISKSRHEVLIAVPGKTRRKCMTVLNTGEGFEHLIDVLSGFGLPVSIGFEATGNYHRPLMFALGAAGFHLNLVSSWLWHDPAKPSTTPGTRMIRKMHR